MDAPGLSGRHVLIIEDEHIVAASLCRALRALGAVVVGPAATVDQALTLLATTPRIDGALLDVNLRGTYAYAVADALIARGVPVVFATGYETTVIAERYRGVPVLQKPFDVEEAAAVLFPTTGS